MPPPASSGPTLHPWSIVGSLVYSAFPSAIVTFTGSVVGTPPPGIAPIDLYCAVTIDAHDNGGAGTETRDLMFQVPVGIAPGTYKWQVVCNPTVVFGNRFIAGTILIP